MDTVLSASLYSSEKDAKKNFLAQVVNQAGQERTYFRARSK